MKKQKGFAVLLILILVAVATVGTGSYFYIKNTKHSLTNDTTHLIEKATYNSTFEADAKIKEFILSDASVEICETLEPIGSAALYDAYSNCVGEFAKARKDISICNYKDYKYHDLCVGDVARAIGDPELCYQINGPLAEVGQHRCYDGVTGIYNSWEKVIKQKAITDQYVNVKNYPYKVVAEIDENIITEDFKGRILNGINQGKYKSVQDCIDSPIVQLDLKDPNATDHPQIKAFVNACAYYILQQDQLLIGEMANSPQTINNISAREKVSSTPVEIKYPELEPKEFWLKIKLEEDNLKNFDEMKEFVLKYSSKKSIASGIPSYDELINSMSSSALQTIFDAHKSSIPSSKEISGITETIDGNRVTLIVKSTKIGYSGRVTMILEDNQWKLENESWAGN